MFPFFRDVRTIAFLPPDFGQEGGTYILHKDSMSSMDALVFVFNGFTIRTTTKPMTEAHYFARFKFKLMPYKQQIYACIRSLLESGDARNSNNEFVYRNALLVIIRLKLKEKYCNCLKTRQQNNILKTRFDEFVRKWIIKFNNEAYLNRNFIEWSRCISNEIENSKL